MTDDTEGNLKNYAIAPRRKAAMPRPAVEDNHADDRVSDGGKPILSTPVAAPAIKPPTEAEKRNLIDSKGGHGSNPKNHLQELRKNRDKTTKRFINISFPSDLKQRLDKASYENGVASAEIVRAAVDKYLHENGYE